MRQRLVAGIFAVAMMTMPGHAQVSVYLGLTPPPIRYEGPPPPPPGPEMTWVDGFWAPQGRHYRWFPGHYEQAPYPGAYWTHAHYDRYPEGWQYHEGHWDHEDHDNGRGHAYGRERGNEGDRGRGHDH